MTARLFTGMAATVLLALILGSCKDMGESVHIPNPGIPPLVASSTTFTLASGGTGAARLSGGTQPYEIADHGDEGVVAAVIVGDSLKLAAVGTGSTVITVRDDGSPRFTVDFNVTVTHFGLDRNQFHLLTGDQDSASIVGGVPPYAIIARGDTSLVRVSLTGTSVQIQGVRAGISTIIVGDGSIPRQLDTLSVTIVTAILFSSQIQPIFTASCVNSGCHPGGGAPFSLQSGSSYANLVNVQAVTGPCAGDMRGVPAAAATSALVKRLEGTCGDQMPLGGTPLAAAQIQLIRDWITQGARNN